MKGDAAKKGAVKIPENLDEYIHRSEYRILFLKYWAIRKAYNAIWKKHHALMVQRGIAKAPKRARKRGFLGVGKPPLEFRE